MSRSTQTTVVLPDLHVPFHNRRLIQSIGKMLHEVRPDHIVFSGDFLDMFSLSSHNEGSLGKLRGIDLSSEYEAGREVMEELIYASPGSKRTFLYGNHEDRFFRYLEQGDTSKVGKELRSPREALGLDKRGFKVLENWQEDSVKIGPHLEVIHGVYCCDGTAKKHLNEFEGSVLFGHTHRVQSYVSGKRGSYNIGFLGDKDSPGFRYTPRWTRARWINAFAVVDLFDDGCFLVNTVQCWNSRFILNGKAY